MHQHHEEDHAPGSTGTVTFKFHTQTNGLHVCYKLMTMKFDTVPLLWSHTTSSVNPSLSNILWVQVLIQLTKLGLDIATGGTSITMKRNPVAPPKKRETRHFRLEIATLT